MAHSIFERKLRIGMVGGGPGAFIGAVHRKAFALDGQYELVAGAFSSDPKKSAQTGKELMLDPKRVYGSFAEMAAVEKTLSPDMRIDAVSIVTPNNVHYPAAKAFLEAGIHVICDKPVCMSASEAKKLKAVIQKSGKIFALTHNYTGYVMVKLARDLVRAGELGKLLKIVVRYPQSWLVTAAEKSGSKQAEWRTDPKRSGAAGCMGDIGTHAENLAEYITGLRMIEICADLTTFVKGRKLDDNGDCLVRWENGVKGILYASQISVGKENTLGIEVHGEKASLKWEQEYPDDLWLYRDGKPGELWRRGNPYIAKHSPAAARLTRLPSGHPEAFLEAFANIYYNVAETIRHTEAKTKVPALALDFPNISDGVRGMEFIEAVVKSSKLGAKWVKLPK